MKKKNKSGEMRISGMRPNEKRDCRYLLSENLEHITEKMKRSCIPNPVGFVVDTTDKFGGILCRSVFRQSTMSEKKASLLLQEKIVELAKRNEFPIFTFACSWAIALQLLSLTSPTAKKNLLSFKLEYKIGTSSKYLVVAVGNGGNSYGIADIQEMPRPEQTAQDGQHRHSGI